MTQSHSENPPNPANSTDRANSIDPAIRIDLGRTMGEVDPNIYGHFIEHLGRCVNGGVYEPDSRLSDSNGFRRDVLAKAQELQPSMLRWPGGTFSKIYRWTDGIGPKETRPKRKNLIWGGIEDNGFGTCEFIRYCRELGAAPFLCVNMATGTPEEAANWVEYCNGTDDTHYANLRRSHGYPEPFGVVYWGLGNEEYGKEDIGALHDPERYVSAAWEFVKYMKLTDPSIELVLVGHSHSPDWNELVLRELGDVCDYLSLHHYSAGKPDSYGDVFLALEGFERTLLRTEEQLRALPARVEGFPKWYRFPPRKREVRLAIDEWNIWEPDNGTASDPYGLETRYNWRDALWTASALNLLQRHARHVGMAQLAQMVNVLAPIFTNAGGSFRQTTFYPLALYREHCGSLSLDARVERPPAIGTATGAVAADRKGDDADSGRDGADIGRNDADIGRDGADIGRNDADIGRDGADIGRDGADAGSDESTVPALDVSATWEPATRTVTLAVVNRDPLRAFRVEPIWLGDGGDGQTPVSIKPIGGYTLNAADWTDRNTFDEPDRVSISSVESAEGQTEDKLLLPPHSVSLFKFAVLRERDG